MKRKPKMRTPDHTRLNLGQKKTTDHSSMDISKSCNQISNWSSTSATITATLLIHAENPMTSEIPTGSHSGCSGIIVNGPDMISMWSGISYLSGWVVNWFVNVRCYGIMKSAGEWSWRKCLGWSLGDRERGSWDWF